MSSKGTTVYTLRIPTSLIEDIEIRIQTSDPRKTGRPRTLTAFLLAAAREKLNKMIRSNRSGRSAQPTSSASSPSSGCSEELKKHLEENDRIIEAWLQGEDDEPNGV